MKKNYKVNSIFNEDGKPFSELISSLFLSLLDKESLFSENSYHTHFK